MIFKTRLWTAGALACEKKVLKTPGFRITRSRAIHLLPDLFIPVILTDHERAQQRKWEWKDPEDDSLL